MYQDTQPAELHDDGSDPWAPFRVTHEAEIAGLLRQLQTSSVPVLVSAPNGVTITTELWSLDTAAKRLNFCADDGHPHLQRLLTSDEAVAVAYLDSVKLQFDLPDLVLVRGTRTSTLQAAAPRTMYRFQRRSGYRVRTLERHGPTAHLRHPAIPDMRLGLRVLDVSIGGCALFVPHDVPPLEPGVRLHGVHVELDLETRFTGTLQIQHIASIPGDQGVRAGCEWIAFDKSAERVLQRYIDQTQKRRRMLALD
jgi:flagellar brake protein